MTEQEFWNGTVDNLAAIAETLELLYGLAKAVFVLLSMLLVTGGLTAGLLFARWFFDLITGRYYL